MGDLVLGRGTTGGGCARLTVDYDQIVPLKVFGALQFAGASLIRRAARSEFSIHEIGVYTLGGFRKGRATDECHPD